MTERDRYRQMPMVDLLDGKYTLVKTENTQIVALRYNEKWREFPVGDNLIGAMFSRLLELETQTGDKCS